MEHLALEVFDLTGSGSQYANLPSNTVIHIRRTSQIFGSGAVFSQEFTLNIPANAHLFGSAGDIHGSRLHEQMNKRKARIWAEGLPLYLGYLRLADEVDVDEDGNVEVSFESGQKTFDEMIEGTKAREVSVGDVVIGVALNRKRTAVFWGGNVVFSLTGLEGYAAKDERLKGVEGCQLTQMFGVGTSTPYVQRWPKLVKSHGKVLDSSGREITGDWTNVQTPYDAEHPFCNINICYPLKVNKEGEEVATRGYTVRLARGKPTTDGGDDQTRYNNAPNFYLLYFIDRLFKDLKIHIDENQAKDVEDLRRVFMLNYGCHYEEIEDNDITTIEHGTPSDKLGRYGQYYLPIVYTDGNNPLMVNGWENAGKAIMLEDFPGKVLMRDVKVKRQGYNGTLLSVGSVEGRVLGRSFGTLSSDFSFSLIKTATEEGNNAYSAYLAYATGDNYPNVEIKEIIDAMRSMFGVRLLFSDDYKRVRIVLLRNVFKSTAVQEISCEVTAGDVKEENGIRGFRMTYGKGTDDTNYYYKGFNDMFPRVSKTWKDTTDRHDYSQWDPDAEYDDVKQRSSAMDRTCYVTPANGNAYVTKVDEEESVLFPTLVEVAAFMDAEDGDCSKTEDEGKTVEEVQIGATPVIMNEVGLTYASLFGGELKAPSPDNPEYAQKIATFGRVTTDSIDYNSPQWWPTADTNNTRYFQINGKLDVYISEGFQIRMEDNYGISNGGTPFDEADPGLCFGIMRSSGPDAYLAYSLDPDDGEGNDTWEIAPGYGAIDHPDTCDNYGSLWDYNGTNYDSTAINTAEQARAELQAQFNGSNAPFNIQGSGYIKYATIVPIEDNTGQVHNALIAVYRSISGSLDLSSLPSLQGKDVYTILSDDASGARLIVELNSCWGREGTLCSLCEKAYGSSTSEIVIDDNGVGSRYGRFSLKLRAEKLNPYYIAGSTDAATRDQYLPIANENLRGRGLCDQFYKEYSYWVRNARIINLPVRMELAQLLSIDDTVRATVGDVTGFINEMEYDISMETGLGNVKMQMMYI